ncbi:GxxExxY protein [Williamwhitmania taraxaci]|uniref:GxxExxY protein n=1 Tax=Williamwhitmania taraxaci TaxID=1640674 RepID=A0A1G6K048_9BACT|nr:GxxExxY protein [Williamwhitmania taraxaci]SDC24258.1 GxxExxY protein [Williamwhitmania taraxaci]
MEEINKLSYAIIGAAYKVHSSLGPGLLESTYEVCLEYELLKIGLKVERQKLLPVFYNEIVLDAGYRVDLLVEDSIIVELKAVADVAPIHRAQLMTYLKLADLPLGLLINFNVTDLKQGINRIIM